MDKKAMINIKQHKRKIQLTSIGLILLLVLALTFTIIGTKYTPTIELTQLQNNSNSQMMGYFIKCDDKNIVVDGGTKEDSNNLQQYIKDTGGTVNAWFITHPHKDHAGAIIDNIKHKIEIKLDKYSSATRMAAIISPPDSSASFDTSVILSNALGMPFSNITPIKTPANANANETLVSIFPIHVFMIPSVS